MSSVHTKGKFLGSGCLASRAPSRARASWALQTLGTLSFWAAALALASGCKVIVEEDKSKSSSASTGTATATATGAAKPAIESGQLLAGAACATPPAPGSQSANKLVSPTDFLWPLGQTMNIHFADGDPDLIELTVKEASEWTQYANLNFKWFKDPSSPPPEVHVRITFKCEGFYTKGLGVLSYHIAAKKGDHSLCLGALREHLNAGPGPAQHGIGSIKHEFGHLLGLAHEHQSPKVKFTWNTDVIHAWCKKTQGWDAEHCDNQITKPITEKEPYNKANFLVSDFDPDSIMLYGYPASFTKEGMATKSNHVLSAIDKQGIAKLYPGRDPNAPPPAQGQEPTQPTQPTQPTGQDANAGLKLSSASKKLGEEGGKETWAFAVGLDGAEAALKDVQQVTYFLPPQLFNPPSATGAKDQPGHPWGGKGTIDDPVSFKVRAVVQLASGNLAMFETEVKLGENQGNATGVTTTLNKLQ
jgi:serralysin